MGVFDFLSKIDWSDPQTMARIGALQGLAAQSAPTAVPTTMGQGFASLFSGAQQGAIGANSYQQQRLQTAQSNLGLQQQLAALNFWRRFRGLPDITADSLFSGGNLKGGGQKPQAVAPDPTPAVIPGASNAPASDAAPDMSAIVPTVEQAESGGNPNAVSTKGAVGPMQLMPGTISNPGFGIKSPQDSSPAENRRVGAEYLNAMKKRYGNTTLALVAYNWGPGNTDKWLKEGADPNKLPAETRSYIGGVLASSMGRGAQAPQQQAAPQQPEATTQDSYSPIQGISQIGEFDVPGANKLLESWMQPQNNRAGSTTTTMGLDGRMHTIQRNPILGEGQTVNDAGVVSNLPGALQSTFESEHAKESGKASVEVPAKKEVAAFEQQLEVQKERAVEAFKNWIKTGGQGFGTADGGLSPTGAAVASHGAPSLPGATLRKDGSAVMKDGTVIPPASLEPPLPQHGEEYIKERQKQVAETENGWADSLPSGQLAEQRAMAIADALKATQSGHWAEEKADIAGKLKAVGLTVSDKYLNDPAAVQEVLKNNFQSTLQQIRAFSSRPAAIEVQLAAKNFANPNLQPEANQQIIAETVGSIRWDRAKILAWDNAKRMGWHDPQAFERAWMQANPIQKYIDQTVKDIGPLKGMKNPVATDIHRGIVSEADVQFTAKKHNVSPEKVREDMRKQGYQVQ